jgi:branched-chain amino acid transport system ATP-binding protein
MTQTGLLEISNICVSHGSFQALCDVSLAVRPGEIVALIGANSSGKSTLLNAISGFIHPTKGSIRFEGKDITHLDTPQIVVLGISQVPEGRRLFPSMTVLDNLIIGSFTGRARSNRKENLKRVFALFPRLKERQGQLAKTLSGGEQQMAALGRCLMSEPKLMLFDEMSLGLSPLLINELYRVMREIRQRGVTILFVEQNVRRSLEEADRAYIMKTGRVVLSGDVEDLRKEEEVKKAYFGI